MQSVAVDAPTAGHWWGQLEDPVLEHLIDSALARNNDLASAALTVRQAQLAAGLAAGQALPTVSVGFNSSSTRALASGSVAARSAGATVAVSYEVDLWRRVANTANAAQWQAEATEQDRQSAALALVATTATLYWRIGYLNQTIALAEQDLAYARRTLDLVRVKRKAGAASALDEAQAEQALAVQLASNVEAIEARTEARFALAILFDSPPEVQRPEPERLPKSGPPALRPDLPASVLARRPDLRAAEGRLRAALATADATRASYYPTLTLTAGATTASNSLANWLANPVASLGAGLILPFVQWSDMQRNVAVSQASYEIAVISFRKTLYSALAEVETALSATQLLAVQGEHLEHSLTAALRAERLSEARYRAGAVPLTTWLDAQRTRRQAESALAENRRAQWTNRVTLFQALGGDEGKFSESFAK